MSRVPAIQDVLSRVPGRVHGGARILFGVLLGVGVVAFGLTLAANPQRAWTALHFNVTYWLTLSQAGVVLAALFLIVRAKWATPLQRIALGYGRFLPYAFAAMLAVLLFGARDVFSWIEHPLPAKEPYLNYPFLLVRMIVLPGALIVLSWLFMNRIRRLDAGLARGRAPENLQGLYEKWSKGWRGDGPELESARRVLPRYAGAIIPIYTVVFTVVCWDLVMSLDPHWATTMIGPWFFMGGILMGFASLGVISHVLRRAYGLDDFLSPKRYHDLGKLIFAFSIFWFYLFFSMYLPIWYANMPEEANWMVLRVREPYLTWSVTAVVLTWLVPFTGLMNLKTKKVAATHVFFAVAVLVGLWFERLVQTYPSIFVPDMPVGFPEIGVTLGFLGGFGLVYQRYAARHPLLPLDRLDEMEEGHH